jgi:hypothetical protein
MKVLLLQEWLGHPAGSVITVRDSLAPSMFERGVAEEFKEKQLKKPSVDKMTKETATK